MTRLNYHFVRAGHIFVKTAPPHSFFGHSNIETTENNDNYDNNNDNVSSSDKKCRTFSLKEKKNEIAIFF